MYIYIYIYIYIYVCINIYICICTYIHIHTCVFMYVLALDPHRLMREMDINDDRYIYGKRASCVNKSSIVWCLFQKRSLLLSPTIPFKNFSSLYFHAVGALPYILHVCHDSFIYVV